MKKSAKRWLLPIIIIAVFACLTIAVGVIVSKGSSSDISLTLYNTVTKTQKTIKTRPGNVYNKLSHAEVQGYEFVGYFFDDNCELELTKDSNVQKSGTLNIEYRKIITKDSRPISIGSEKNIKIISSPSTPLDWTDFSLIKRASLISIDLSDCYFIEPTLPAQAFYNSRIREIKLFKNIQVIGEEAFQNCYNLSSISLSSGLTEIGDRAFYNCKSLKSLVLPSRVETLGSKVFGFSGIKEISLPETLKNIQSDTFSGLVVENISLLGENIHFNLKNGILYTADNSKLICCFNPTNVVVEPETKEIVEGAFENCSSLETINLGGVETIGARAFSGCNNLREITFGYGALTICESAFENCQSLKELTFPKELKEIGYRAFALCLGLKNVSMEQAEIESIGAQAFAGCRSLKTLTLPSELVQLGEGAFMSCGALKQIELPFGVERISARCFQDAAALESVEAEGIVAIDKYAFAGCSLLRDLSFAEGVMTIGEGAFMGCTSVQGVSFSKLEVLSENAFADCTKLFSAFFTSLTTIKDNAFAGCSMLKTFNVPRTMEQITPSAFAGCDELYSFEGGSSNYVCDNGVLYNGDQSAIICYPNAKIDESFTIIESVNSIEEGQLNANRFLKSIDVEQSNMSFCGVSGVLYSKTQDKLICYPMAKTGSRFSVPAQVKTIGAGAFSQNTELASLTIGNGVERIEKNALYGASNILTLYVPFLGESLEKQGFIGYLFGAESYFNNSEYVPRQLAIVTVTKATRVDDYAFYGLTDIISVSYTGDVRSVGEGAFQGATALKIVNLSGGLEEVKDRAFYGDRALSELAFGYSANLVLGNWCFSGLSGGVEVQLKNCPSTAALAEVRGKVVACYAAAKDWKWPQ